MSMGYIRDPVDTQRRLFNSHSGDRQSHTCILRRIQGKLDVLCVTFLAFRVPVQGIPKPPASLSPTPGFCFLRRSTDYIHGVVPLRGRGLIGRRTDRSGFGRWCIHCKYSSACRETGALFPAGTHFSTAGRMSFSQAVSPSCCICCRILAWRPSK